MATYAVGDIQGCLAPLQRLLERVGFQPGRDTLWSVGDAINRGGRCLETLRYLRELGNSLVMVLGNHDLNLLAVAAGARPLGAADTIGPILEAPDAGELLHWVRHRPLLHRERDCILVHAGIPPQWSGDEAQARAREVETVLRSERCDEFLHYMYGDDPALWSAGLQGMTRLRVITNYFTRMRFCDADGRLDLSNKGPPGEEVEPGMRPWFAHPGRRTAGETIIFGHWATLAGHTGRSDVIGLDTGCVWGGAMTLYCLESGEFFRCNC